MTILNPRKITSAVAALLLVVFTNAQQACPAVNAGPDVVMPCGATCTNLVASPLVTGATTSYGVSQITYTPFPFNAGTQVLANLDDRFSDTLSLPFNFCFFGGTYTKALIGANGVISFNDTNRNKYNNYSINSPLPAPGTPPDVFNSIMAPWQDIDPVNRGRIFYQILGTAPCRMFVASWDSIPYFGSADSRDPQYCNIPLYASSQVVIYETTNIIDIFIKNKDTCAGWNKNAIQGILDATGTAFAVVPGRNSGAWAAQNEGWRFTPNGTPTYVTEWLDQNGTVIRTGDTVQVCLPNQLSATYTARTTYTPCSGGTPVVVTDDVTVSHTGTLLAQIDSARDVSCAGLNNGRAWASYTGGSGAVTYGWSNGATTLAINGLQPGTYTFTITDNSGCTLGDTVTVNVNTTNTLVAAPIITDASCYRALNGAIDANPSGGTSPYTFLWSSPSGETTQKIANLAAGNYSSTVTDAQGCSVLATATVRDPQELQIAIDSIAAVKCKGDANGAIKVRVIGGTPPYNSSATKDFSVFYSADSNGVIPGLPAGTYTAIAFDDNGCQEFVTVVVPDALPDEFEVFVDSTSCYGPGYTDGSIRISTLTAANTPYQFSLDSGQQQFAGEFFNVSAGVHTVEATNINGCVTVLPVVVPEPLPIIVDVIPDTVDIILGGSQQVEVTFQNATNPFYEWSPSLGLSCIDCPNPVVAPYESGEYVVNVNMQNRDVVCSGSATLYVRVGPHKPVFVPNSFTPNGDFNNDLFQLFGEGIKGVDLKIFNRWGETVFESRGQFDGWDGRFKGEQLAPQVFTYRAIVTFLDNEQVEKKGSVTLLR